MVKIEERKEMIRTQSKIFNRDFEKGYDKSNLTSMRKFSLMFSIFAKMLSFNPSTSGATLSLI